MVEGKEEMGGRKWEARRFVDGRWRLLVLGGGQRMTSPADEKPVFEENMLNEQRKPISQFTSAMP